MIKLNRTTEYGIMALRHMSQKGTTELTSAREVADTFGLPFEITAKTLLKLKDSGLIRSAQGARGGYTLARSPKEVTLAEFLEKMEGPQGVVHCSNPAPSTPEIADASCCEYKTRCGISGAMNTLQSRVTKFLDGIKLSELTESTVAPSSQNQPFAVLGAEP